MQIRIKDLQHTIYITVYEVRCVMLIKYDKKRKRFIDINERKSERYLKSLGVTFDEFIENNVKECINEK
jgi:hypothetical protein